MKKCEDCLGFGSFIVPDDVESSLASEQDKYLICKKCGKKCIDYDFMTKNALSN